MSDIFNPQTISSLPSGTTATTQALGNSSTLVATTAFVQQSVLGGFTNKFRNAAMDIWQRGTSGGNITTGNTAYTADGWIVGATGATVAWTQGGGTISTPDTWYSLKLTGNTSMSDTFVRQRIESLVSVMLANETVTIQASIVNQTGATITPTIYTRIAGSQDNWTSPTTDLSSANLQSCPAGATPTRVAYTYTVGGTAYYGLEVTIDFGSALNSNSNYIEITALSIQYTPGVSTGQNSNPPLPELRPVFVELPINQRYYRKSFPQGTTPAQGAGVSGAVCIKNPIALGDPGEWVPFNPPMRAAPSVTTYNPVSSNANWRDVTASSDVTVSVDPASALNDSGILLATSGTVATLGDILAIHYTASAEL